MTSLILAVDDEEKSLRVLCSAIREAEPEAELAAFIQKAEVEKWLKENVPDIAFLDIQLGQESGMELAKTIKQVNPRANLIFVTAYDSHMQEAIRLHSSGYIMKPVLAADIRREMDNLLFPMVHHEKKIEARCFGRFELFVDEKPMAFRLAKAKELLALLIDHKGASVTRRELTVRLFEDEQYTQQSQDYFSKAFRSLKSSLEEAGIGELVGKNHGNYFVDMSFLDCDAVHFEEGDPKAVSSFQGEYMSQYSWAEESIGRFMKV